MRCALALIATEGLITAGFVGEPSHHRAINPSDPASTQLI
jgi:hypothetical protein